MLPTVITDTRLDRLVSGVLVIARTTEKAALFHKHLQQDFIEKEYLARVKADTPTVCLVQCFIRWCTGDIS